MCGYGLLTAMCALLEHVHALLACRDLSSFGGPDARWASGAFGLRAG